MEFHDLAQRAIDVRKKYAELEQMNYGSAWTSEELALGFVGDVGDLAKLIMAKNGRRSIPDVEHKLAHELADCLWSIIVLAHIHDVDLEQAFVQTMNELERHINIRLRDSGTV
ncbi:MAG: nucleotide pyrophosphohydrolase [Chloroflexi bacterium]|nr:nucleotide pyrophosphohydrolase [Chloroflexota bacterium]